jgi:hypothetical protein
MTQHILVYQYLKNLKFGDMFRLIEPSSGQIQNIVLIHSVSAYTMGFHGAYKKKIYANFNQQYVAKYNILCYCQSSICCGRFPRPSSGARKLYMEHLVFVKLSCCYC